MDIPRESNKVYANLPAGDRDLLQAELDKGYESWIYHFTGNCTGCSRCNHGPPTQDDLMPYFKSGESGAYSAWLSDNF